MVMSLTRTPGVSLSSTVSSFSTYLRRRFDSGQRKPSTDSQLGPGALFDR